MKRAKTFTFCIAALFSATVLAAAPAQQRVRGTIETFNPHQLTVHTRFGKTATIALNDKTAYAWVVGSSLANIKKDDFIGTAVRYENGKLVALELVIFPNSMRGMGEGHYPWDKLPAVAQGPQGRKLVSASMTNGTVENAGPAAGRKLVSASMTNGNVASSQAAAGGREITVTYKGGQERIRVPEGVPVVAFQKADRAILAKGAHVFVVAADHDGMLTAGFVAVGKDGVKPPM